MYFNAGYVYEADEGHLDTEHPLSVNSCGIIRLKNREYFETNRPTGRTDHQLLYVSTGKLYLCQTEHAEMVPQGSILLFRPGEKQHYYYYKEDKPEICWIHFSGFEAGKNMDEIGFANQHMLSCGNSQEIFPLFQKIVQELQMRREEYQEVSVLLFHQLMIQIKRAVVEKYERSSKKRELVEGALKDFGETFTQDISIEAYAKSQFVSVCWFIKCFKQYAGVTPTQYITSLRLNKAKELLTGTDLTIKETGLLSGYEDTFYFSRIFKKNTGMSPREYRNL